MVDRKDIIMEWMVDRNDIKDIKDKGYDQQCIHCICACVN